MHSFIHEIDSQKYFSYCCVSGEKKSFYASMNLIWKYAALLFSHTRGTDADFHRDFCSILLFNARSRCILLHVWNQLSAVKKDDIYFFNINAAHVCHILCESHKSQLTFNYNAHHVHNKMQCLSLIKIYFIQWWIVLDISTQLIHMNEAINIFIRFPQYFGVH